MAQFEEIGVQAVVRGVGKYQSDLGKVEGKTRGTADKLKSIGSGMQRAGKGLTIGATLPILAVGGASLKMAADFETAFTEVTTLFDLPEKQIKDLREGVLDLSSTMGLDAVETTKALYQAISAGVEPAKALAFIETNAKLAIGGVSDLETVVDLTTTTINAFGLEIEDTSAVTDTLFKGVEKGKTTVAELGASLFQVAPAAAASGINIEQVVASVAALTAGGFPTAQTMTSLKVGFLELGKSGTKANKAFEEVAGIGFRDFIAQGGDIAEVMVLLRQKAEEDGVAISDLFGSIEAGTAIGFLAVDVFDKLEDGLDAMGNKTGAAGDAFDKMEKTAARDFAKLQANFKRILIDLGTVLLPVMTDFMAAMLPVIKFIGKLVGAFSNLPGPVKTIVIAIIGLVAALGPLLLIFGTIISAVGSILPIIAGLGALLSGPLAAGFIAVLLPLLPFIAAAVVLAGIAFLIIKNWGKIKKFFGSLAPVVKKLVKLFTGIPKAILKSLKKFADTLKKNWKKIVQVALAILFPPAGGLFFIITNFNKIKETAGRIFSDFVDLIKRLASDLVNAVIGFFKGLKDKVLETGRTLVTAYVGFWMGLATDVLGVVTGLVSDIVGFFTALPGRIVSAMGSLVSDLAGIGEDMITSFIERLERGLPRVLGFFLDLPGKILSVLGDAGGLLFELGKTLIQSLLDGMAAVAGLGGDIAKGIANTLIKAMNTVLDFLGDAILLLNKALGKLPGKNPAAKLLNELAKILKEGVPLLQGGLFRVPGSGSQDEFPAVLAPGEMVVPRGPADILRRMFGSAPEMTAALTDSARSPALQVAAPFASPASSLAVNAPISVTVNSQNWNEVRRIVHEAVDGALETSRQETVRAGAELTASIG